MADYSPAGWATMDLEDTGLRAGADQGDPQTRHAALPNAGNCIVSGPDPPTHSVASVVSGCARVTHPCRPSLVFPALAPHFHSSTSRPLAAPVHAHSSSENLHSTRSHHASSPIHPQPPPIIAPPHPLRSPTSSPCTHTHTEPQPFYRRSPPTFYHSARQQQQLLHTTTHTPQPTPTTHTQHHTSHRPPVSGSASRVGSPSMTGQTRRPSSSSPALRPLPTRTAPRTSSRRGRGTRYRRGGRGDGT